ncbi:hypothetical protein HYV44_02740 [Candidatus Microgenomates bacterium]|nr:hypothetical protein [Candidatus Microgenomates bacterium]
MKIDIKAFSLAMALFWGFSVTIITLVNVYFGVWGSYVSLINEIYPWGYESSISGALIGLVYGLIDGFVGGAVFAAFYNFFIKK